MLNKGFDKPIISIALREYFMNNKSIRETITSHKEVLDFCMTQKIGKKFKLLYGDEYIQRTSRWYASKNGKYLYKYNNGKKSHVLKNQGVSIINNIKDFQNNIDYSYYIRETNKIINEVEMEIKQMKLW